MCFYIVRYFLVFSFIYLPFFSFFFFFNDTATTEIYTLSLHDALPILRRRTRADRGEAWARPGSRTHCRRRPGAAAGASRSEEHTSELQSLAYLVCRLLLEKKKKKKKKSHIEGDTRNRGMMYDVNT